MSKYKEKLKNEKESYSTGLFKKGKLKPRMVSPSDMMLKERRKLKKKILIKDKR